MHAHQGGTPSRSKYQPVCRTESTEGVMGAKIKVTPKKDEKKPNKQRYAERTSSISSGKIRMIRPALNQQEFDDMYGFMPQAGKDLRTRVAECCSCPQPSRACLLHTLGRFVPILGWLPHYRRSTFISDLIAGLTLGSFLVPQGMAYATLAGLDPIYGLYTSFFPPLLYMIFGTSRQDNIGVFAVVSLMVGTVRWRVLPSVPVAGRVLATVVNSTAAAVNATPTAQVSPIFPNAGYLTPIQVITALSFAIGIVHVISGFTIGAAFHVLSSQVNKIFAVKVGMYVGPFKLFYVFRDVVMNLPHTNLATLTISLVTIVLLYFAKQYINPSFSKRFGVPIPFELIAVIIATALSHFFGFEAKYGVRVVSHIPTGLPNPSLPRFDLIPSLMGDAVGIALVIFVITASLGKLFGKKHGYRIDPAQELRALGIVQCVSSMLSCHPGSGSLTRALLNSQIGAQTQLYNLFSGSFVLIVILWMGPLLEPLPASIFLISFLSTVLWDVKEGLMVSITFALLTVIFRSQWPASAELGRLPRTDQYRNVTRYTSVETFGDIKVFRFDSPLLFTNIEMFKDRAHDLTNLYIEEYSTSKKDDVEGGVGGDISTRIALKAIVIDASGFTYIDCMGVAALKEIAQEMNEKGIRVYFAACKAPVRDLFASSGFFEIVKKSRFYPSVHDAVVCALFDCGKDYTKLQSFGLSLLQRFNTDLVQSSGKKSPPSRMGRVISPMPSRLSVVEGSSGDSSSTEDANHHQQQRVNHMVIEHLANDQHYQPDADDDIGTGHNRQQLPEPFDSSAEGNDVESTSVGGQQRV